MNIYCIECLITFPRIYHSCYGGGRGIINSGMYHENVYHFIFVYSLYLLVINQNATYVSFTYIFIAYTSTVLYIANVQW